MVPSFSLRRLGWLVLGVAIAIVNVTAPGMGEEVAGFWKGTAPSPIGGDDTWEVCIKSDGTFAGALQSRRGGHIPLSGSYNPGQGTLEFQGTYQGVQARSAFSWSLSAAPGSLEGTGISLQFNRPYTIKLRKAGDSC